MTAHRIGFLVCTVALLAAGVLGPDHLAAQDAAEFTRWYQGLRDLRPDPTRGAKVRALTLTRDAGTFHFGDGQIHLLEPIDGRTIGAVFVGEGRFEMAAPERVEQDQLRRAYGVSSIATPFRAAVLLFSDSTGSELDAAGLTWGPLEPHRDAEREVREAREYFTDGDGWADRKVILPLINAGPGFFYAHFSEDRGDPMIFSVDPYAFEQVSLSKRSDRGKRREVVAQFHRQADYVTGRSTRQEELDLIRITSYDIETTIEGDLDLVGRATATVRRLASTFHWIPFRLFPELEMDSIRWGDGSPAVFYRAEDLSDLWVDFSTAPAEESPLTFHYSGDMLEEPNRLWVVLGTHTTWYPVYEFWREVSYRLTFHVPDDYVVTTVGTKLSESTDDGVTTSTWETAPVRLLTFNIGKFDEWESEVEDAPNLSVLINEQAHRRLEGFVSDAGGFMLRQRNMAEAVAMNIIDSFRFYNDVYGPTTLRDFVATEIPYAHGEAYAGLIMLAQSTFQWSSERGMDDIFRAHEVAHQWWGISVRPATYRDWWLAEGFSEFSAWWFTATTFGAIDLYRDLLKDTREEILDRRDKSAPVGLGQRAGTSEDPGDYYLMVYHKGAWVLHMLRTLLRDPDTGSDDAFTQVMRTFYTNHLGGLATTREFQQVVEQVVGAEMGWFFDQWVYGSSIPTYTFSHTFTDEPDGSVRVTVRIRQEDVPEDFRMIVPILLDFGDEGSALVQVDVVGPVTQVDLPLLPREPDNILFNPYESVLAETKTERWRN